TWTGGKDSTTNLWIIRQVCVEENIDLPQVITIDEGDAFPEITDFLVNISKKWNIDLKWLCNFDMLKCCQSHLGNDIQVKDLDERNQAELKRIEFEFKSFPFEAESYAGNHLMKTVVLNKFLEQSKTELLFMALRRDEQAARKEDEYFTHHEAGYLMPEHTRVSPILHFTERDIWDNIKLHHLPYCPLYEIGYRSLGARTSSNPGEVGVPAWEQDIENVPERAGRRQDKEKAMERLRKLGYM
ncbi:MAG: phosphoadenosine phosphosulfate reductase family protein, partial [Candidatus Atribacteria bacterium]|nr:phosphoadenosine phosphosulfate reductase family protein [Candidatus Atribacteria bacterium]